MSLHTTAGYVTAVGPDRVWFLVPEWRPLQPIAVPTRDFDLFNRPPAVGEWFAFQWNPRGRRPMDLWLCVYGRCNAPGWAQFYFNGIHFGTRQTRAASRARGFGREWIHRGMTILGHPDSVASGGW